MADEAGAETARQHLSLAIADDSVELDYGTRDGPRDPRSGVNRIDSAAGAFARTMVSSLSFMFQRPIRLFRPVQCT